MSVASVSAGNADVLRLEERPLEYIAEQVSRGINVVYMGRSGDWFRFDFFFDFEGEGVGGGAHGRYRCRDLVLGSNAEYGDVLELMSMLRVLRVDLQKREVVLDVRSFNEAMKKVGKKRIGEHGALPNGSEPPPHPATSPQT